MAFNDKGFEDWMPAIQALIGKFQMESHCRISSPFHSFK